MSEDDFFEYIEEEKNIVSEKDYEEITEPFDVEIVQDEEEVIQDTDRPLDIPMDLIRLGKKIKNVTDKRRQKKSQ